VLTPAIFQRRQADRFADNEFQRITEGSFRELAADMLATFVPLAEANVPAYDPTRFYAEEYLVTFDGLYYKAKIQGFLPAPTPGEETAEWKPDFKPLPPTLPYREMSAQQGRDFGSDGLLVPSTLYRLTGRVDAGGDALDDVLVVALSRHNVNEADAYTIGLDPQTREEYQVAVSYELATDTTAPRSAGIGGAGGYTKAEADMLLAAKGSAQVQAQHTLQLATLGVQASPVMAYKGGDTVAGYLTLDEALADSDSKVFQRFNVAELTLSQSNSPAVPGWAAYSNGEGATLFLANNAVLSLPGTSSDALRVENFFVFQAPGSRLGRIDVLSTYGAGSDPATLPKFLNNRIAVPMRFYGGAITIEGGSYVAFQGTGEVHLFGNVATGFVDAGITIVDHRSTGSGGGGQGAGRVQLTTIAGARVAAIVLKSAQDTFTDLALFDNTTSAKFQLNQRVAGNWQAGVQQALPEVNAAISVLTPQELADGAEVEIETVAITPANPLTVIFNGPMGGYLRGSRAARRVYNPAASPEPQVGFAFNKAAQNQCFSFPNPTLPEGCVTFWMKRNLQPGAGNEYWLLSARPASNLYAVVDGNFGLEYYVDGKAYDNTLLGSAAGQWVRVVIQLPAMQVGTINFLSGFPGTGAGVNNVEIFDLRFYSRRFSAAELADRTAAPADSLLARFTFPATLDPTQPVTDESGHGNHGTLYNF